MEPAAAPSFFFLTTVVWDYGDDCVVDLTRLDFPKSLLGVFFFNWGGSQKEGWGWKTQMFSDDWRLSTFPCISSGAWQLFRLSVSCTLRLKTTVDYSSSGWVLLHRGQNEMQRLWSRKAFSFSNFVVAPLFSLCLFWNGMGKCIDDSLSLCSD